MNASPGSSGPPSQSYHNRAEAKEVAAHQIAAQSPKDESVITISDAADGSERTASPDERVGWDDLFGKSAGPMLISITLLSGALVLHVTIP